MKNYRKIEVFAGSTIEDAINELGKHKDLVCIEFNTKILYSDIDDLDSAFKKITGKTKSEFDEAERKRQAEYELEKREHKESIPKLTVEWIEKGNKVLDKKHHSLWAKIVPIRLNDLYRGFELGACLDIVEQLNNNCELSAINNQFAYPASKYRRKLESNNTNTSYGSHHWPVLRFSDVLLMYAEAENKLTPGSALALNAVNRVRNRAKATPLNTITEEAIQEERLLELCFEGHRKYDLVRWGILEQKVNETKTIMEALAGNPNFINDDWTSYGEPNLGPDGIPESGDEPAVRNIRKNSLHSSFNYYDGYNDFDANKHYILPIPEQELGVNTNLRQTTGW